MKKLLFTLIALVFLNSCRGDDDLDIGTYVGEWNWVSTTGGINNETTTPASTGNTIVLSFTSDKKYTITTNGTVTNEGTYSLYKDISELSHYEATYIDFSNYPDKMIKNNENDQLILSDDFNDGYTETYHKK